jgi:CrcB protein
MGQVLVGGVFGAAAREAMEQAITTPKDAFPLATFVVNLSGAFLLGVVLEALVRSGDDSGRRRTARLVAGTGFMGAFTTYSTFALEADLLLRAGHPVLALGYVVATLAGGLAATGAGIAFAAGRARRSITLLPVDSDVDIEDGR